MDLYQELAGLVDALDAEGAAYAICGALALAVHGAPRATRDLDLIARKEDEAKVRAAVRRAGYPFEALPMEFSSKIEVQRFSKLVDGRPLMIDFLWASGPLEAIWGRRQAIPWRGRTFFVVTREDLVALKLTAGRPQDLVDIQALTALEGRRDKG